MPDMTRDGELGRTFDRPENVVYGRVVSRDVLIMLAAGGILAEVVDGTYVGDRPPVPTTEEGAKLLGKLATGR